MKYEITKEQILKLANKAEQGCTSVIEPDLKNWFPEAFKKELEIGKWYKRPHNSALFYVTEILNIDSNYCKVFGFDNLGNWMAENAKTFPDNDFEATPKQVETALINEAKKRGYKQGVEIYGLYRDGESHGSTTIIKTNTFEFDEHDNSLDCNNNGYRLFCNGSWAEIISQEKTVVPMDKALKIIAKKMKVSPENIEIQS